MLSALSTQLLAARIAASPDDAAQRVSLISKMSNPSCPHDGSGAGETPPAGSRTALLFEQMAALKEMLAEGRELFPPHWDISPQWDLHESRRDEIERLMRLGLPEDRERIETLRADFLLHLNAEMASSMAEPIKRLARFMDQVLDRQPENKFVIPLDAFDCAEDLLLPYEGGL